jgi:hypothetical protein
LIICGAGLSSLFLALVEVFVEDLLAFFLFLSGLLVFSKACA